MDTNEVLQGLLAKRAELVERLEQIDRERPAIVDDIAALDRAVKVFDPAHAPVAMTRRRNGRRPAAAVAFGRRELPTLIGQVLRGADGPMTTADVAAAIADRKQIPAEDKRRRSWLATRVGVAMNALEKSRAVAGSRTTGDRSVRWTQAR
jgi:hypothetical protein